MQIIIKEYSVQNPLVVKKFTEESSPSVIHLEKDYGNTDESKRRDLLLEEEKRTTPPNRGQKEVVWSNKFRRNQPLDLST